MSVAIKNEYPPNYDHYDRLSQPQPERQQGETKSTTTYAMKGKIASIERGRPSGADHSDEVELDDLQPEPKPGYLCEEPIYWWGGEYEGECKLPKGHLEPFHYDGESYYDSDMNDRSFEQEKLTKLITAQVQAAEARGYERGNKMLTETFQRALRLADAQAAKRELDALLGAGDNLDGEWYRETIAARLKWPDLAILGDSHE